MTPLLAAELLIGAVVTPIALLCFGLYAPARALCRWLRVIASLVLSGFAAMASVLREFRGERGMVPSPGLVYRDEDATQPMEMVR